MSALIKIVGLPDGSAFTVDFWVKSFDPDIESGTASEFFQDGTAVIKGAFGGETIITRHRDDAQRFDSNAAALNTWRTASAKRPLRPDGKPNRPMTGLTVEVELA